MKMKINIVWIRRDLRLPDQAALYHALRSGLPVLPLFIFDTNILDELDPEDKRVVFIHQTLKEVKEELKKLGSDLKVSHGDPLESFTSLANEYQIDTVFTNHDYEPYAIQRDQEVQNILQKSGIKFKTYKDQVIFEKDEVLKDDGSPYTVFTPYSKKWKARLDTFYLKPYPTETYFSNLLKDISFSFPTLEQLGFTAIPHQFPEKKLRENMLLQYHLQRDIPSVDGTSQLSVHLRFGTISIRQLAAKALTGNEKFLNELIWRDFYQMILWHFPNVVNHSFKPAYDNIPWENNEAHFQAWCEGRTGYPIVDAGMRQLNETGWMHNRVRMIVASFLSKHLLIDWRWGEAYFAKKLLDFDLASNNGGWQWAAGSGVDAAPYFRIFNPTLQTLKFDPAMIYIRQWVPEFDSFSYPSPIVIHEKARVRYLEVVKDTIRHD